MRGVRYRGVIPEARTKWEATQAESKIKQEIFEGRFGLVQSGTMKLVDFIDEIYLPWARANKRSWKGDNALHPRCPIQRQVVSREICPQIGRTNETAAITAAAHYLI